MLDNFWDHVEEYRKLGYDPLRWIASCSGEVDLHDFRAATQEVKKTSVRVSPSWFDAFPYAEGKVPELTRRVYDFASPVVDKEIEVKRALAVFRVLSGTAEQPHKLAEGMQNFLKAFSSKTSIARASVALTEHQDAQFALLDYIGLHRGDKAGYMPATTAVTHATDVLRSPDSEIHSSIAMTSAIETLNLLGCGVNSSFRLFPIYDAPSEDMLDRIRSNLDAFTSRYNLAMEDYSSLKRGRLFYGVTAMASTTKELPTRYDLVEEGMEIMLTNKLGGLPALSLYTLARMDSENIIKYEQAGASFARITEARDEALRSLSEPHFALGKIIAKHCPDFGAPFDKGAHIIAVHPIGPQGIFALASLAGLANSQLVINALPVRDEGIARFAAREFLVENATASINGCHLIVATREVADRVEEDLKKHNFAPERIGFAGKKGVAFVEMDMGLAGQYVASKAKLARFEPARPQPPAEQPLPQQQQQQPPQ